MRGSVTRQSQQKQIRRSESAAQQQGRFRLPAERARYGVGLLRTSEGARAKFLIAWSDESGAPTVDLVAATVYDEESGAGTSKRHPTLRLGPGSAVDLDFLREGATPPPPEKAFDLGFRIGEDGEPLLESLGDAAAEFPTQSFCGEPPKEEAPPASS